MVLIKTRTLLVTRWLGHGTLFLPLTLTLGIGSLLITLTSSGLGSRESRCGRRSPTSNSSKCDLDFRCRTLGNRGGRKGNPKGDGSKTMLKKK